MSIQVEFHRLAAKEARETEAWYAGRSQDAAIEFHSGVVRAAQRIAQGVETHRIRTKFWYIRIRRYPYRLIFIFEHSLLARILAVAHCRRRTDYWRSRR